MWLETYMDAVRLATEAHNGQFRMTNANDGRKEPYIIHPLRVSKHVFDLTGDLRLATAAVLHDVLEDTPVTDTVLAGHFEYPINQEILRLVVGLTKNVSLPKAEKEAEYLERFRQSDADIAIIKLADRYDNVTDLLNQSLGFQERYKANTIELLKAVPHQNHPIVRHLMNQVDFRINLK